MARTSGAILLVRPVGVVLMPLASRRILISLIILDPIHSTRRPGASPRDIADELRDFTAGPRLLLIAAFAIVIGVDQRLRRAWRCWR